jgi:hypothetical protein
MRQGLTLGYEADESTFKNLVYAGELLSGCIRLTEGERQA